MSSNRGDVVLAYYPFSSGTGGSRRPVLVIQNDTDNGRLTNTIVAQITSNLQRASEPTQLLIEVSTAEGQQSGLLQDSVVSCNNLATIEQTLINRKIGNLSAAMMQKIDACLKAALGLP
jgi:mRNA interferase MazF